MKQGREQDRDDAVPTAEDWAALCSAVMRCELALEKLAGKGGKAGAAKQTRALVARLRKLQHEPACRWLEAHPAYRTAHAAYARRVGRGEADRFELLAALSYAMEALHADEPAAPPQPTAAMRRQAIRHAHELAALVARDGAGCEHLEDDEALLALLQRLIAHNEKAVRVAPTTGREPERQLRFGKDLAHLLIASVGSAPPSVIRPLLKLAGPPVSERVVATLLAQVRREAQQLEGEPLAREAREILDRIAFAPTPRTRKTATVR